MLTFSKQLQSRSFYVVERMRKSAQCPQIKNARAKRAKQLFFIVKYANFCRSCCNRRRGCVKALANGFNICFNIHSILLYAVGRLLNDVGRWDEQTVSIFIDTIAPKRSRAMHKLTRFFSRNHRNTHGYWA